MRERNTDACNTRKMVGTRLHRVRHSWAIDPGLINHGRDAIGSLPFFAYFDIFGVLFVKNFSLVGVNDRMEIPK